MMRQLPAAQGSAADQYEDHGVPRLGKPIAAGHKNVPNPAARPHDVKSLLVLAVEACQTIVSAWQP